MGKKGIETMQGMKGVRDLCYDGKNTCKKLTDCYYQEYLSDNKANEAVIDSVLMEKGIKLIIAPTGAGKSTIILSRAEKLVAMDSTLKIILALPIRALTLQLGNNAGVNAMVGGDSFDDNSRITTTTYEKMFEVEDYIHKQRMAGVQEKVVLVLDECHLLTTQHSFREKAIKQIISCIENNYFHSVVLVTATPNPMTLYHCDEIVEFQSYNTVPDIDRLEVIAVDDVAEYVRGIDFGKEFPFIRLNSTKVIDRLMADMPCTFARLTKEDKNEKVYLDIVNGGRIDPAGIKGILSTSVIEAGLSVTDYPNNIVPMAVFPDNNISVDDIEQFLNRIRRKGKQHVELARVIVKKPKQEEIKVSLVSGDNEICIFQDVRMEMGDLFINDTWLMDSVNDGWYWLSFEIGGNTFGRHFMVSSSGMTNEHRYSKKDAKTIIFKGMGFRAFMDIFRKNYREKDKLDEAYKMLSEIYEAKWMAMVTDNEAEIARQEFEDKDLLGRLMRGLPKEFGELGDSISCRDGVPEMDKRICYEVSYKQYQRQFYCNHDILAKELGERLGSSVEILEMDTAKGKRAVKNPDDIWEDIEPLRKQIEQNCNPQFWNYLMNGDYEKYLCRYSSKDIVLEVREQEHIMEMLRNLDKNGVRGEIALQIMASSRKKAKVTEYFNCYHTILYNKLLKEFDGTDLEELLHYIPKGKKNNIETQAVIYYYLTRKGQTSYRNTKGLAKEVRDFYEKSFPQRKSFPTEGQIDRKIRHMYISKGKDAIHNQLRTNESDIFKLIESDYK